MWLALLAMTRKCDEVELELLNIGWIYKFQTPKQHFDSGMRNPCPQSLASFMQGMDCGYGKTIAFRISRLFIEHTLLGVDCMIRLG